MENIWENVSKELPATYSLYKISTLYWFERKCPHRASYLSPCYLLKALFREVIEISGGVDLVCMLLGQSLEGLYMSRSVFAVRVDGHVAVHQHPALAACCHVSLSLMDVPGNVGLNNLFLQEFDFITLFYHRKD